MITALPKKWLIAGTVFAAVLGIACGSQVSSSAGGAPTVSDTDVVASDTQQAVPETGSGPSPIIDPDPLYQTELDASRLQTSGWRTDFSRHTVPFEDILSGGVGRDGIPPIDNPRFETIVEAEPVMNDLEPVITFKINGEAKAYPLAILTWHEVVNDVVGGVPVTVTFCPLCNTAIAFKRTLEG